MKRAADGQATDEMQADDPMKPVPPFAMSSGAEICANQIGALCWRMHLAHVQVLLITSRDTGRWIIPKGWPIRGCSAAESAAREAWEEAGVEGQPASEALGVFHYRKVMAEAVFIPCAVEVFPIRVVKLRHRFPERNQRQRKWFDTRKAARLVAEPELRALLEGLDADPRFAALAGM